MNEINFRVEVQQQPVEGEVPALLAVVGPVLQGLLYALKREVVEQNGGYAELKLFMLPRAYRPGAGDCGICFEYAVHDAVTRRDPLIMGRVNDALKWCNVPGSDTASILFGAEKSGALQLIGNAARFLTEESRVLTGAQAQPPKLKQWIQSVADAFRRQTVRAQLPSSIAGLWKADLFLGNRDSDRWVGTTVKINSLHLEGAPGLRVGIVPAQYGSDRLWFDKQRNLVVCPLPYDGAFMEVFYSAWFIVKSFLGADAYLPKPEELPVASHRYVAKLLEERRQFPVSAVIDSLQKFAQPGLLWTRDVREANTADQGIVDTVLAPTPLQVR